MKQTDLSPSQIGYRLRISAIKRADYLNGESRVAASMMGKAREIAIPVVKNELQKFYSKKPQR